MYQHWHFDYDLSEEGKSAMESFLSKPSQLKEGKHRYELENFGLSSQLVKKQLYRYFKEFLLGWDSSIKKMVFLKGLFISTSFQKYS